MASNNNDNSSTPNVSQLGKGLNTDFAPQVQPEGTYRFALNAVDETELGDTSFLSNEEANEISASITEGFSIIGKKFIGSGDIVLFLVKDGISEIGIFNEKGTYTIHVNDETSTDKLNFNIEHQIDSVYRLRRGCERTIYFTDDYNVPRYYNFDKPYDYKDQGKFSATLFNLFGTFKKIPSFKNIEIIEGGRLPAGSYNVAIQYLDNDLNPTEWVTVSETVIIYNDSMSKDFYEIRGSTNAVNSYQDFGITDKAIKVTIDPDSIDTNYSLYRLALVEANNGSGRVSKISATEELSTENLTFTFNGDNTVTTVTEEELLTPSISVEKVSHIEQIENKLLLSGIKGKEVDWWKLQKYASKICTDLVLKNITLNKIQQFNPKTGEVNTQGIGYMPGEIYSLGIVYVFKDGTTSPAFHIPGKNPNRDDAFIFTTGIGNKPMRSTNNRCQSTVYNQLTDKCTGKDYWGVDEKGDPLSNSLVNTFVRHHRFPLRSEVGEPLFTKGASYDTCNASIKIKGFNPIGGTKLDIKFYYHLQSDAEDSQQREVTYHLDTTKTPSLFYIYRKKILVVDTAPIILRGLSISSVGDGIKLYFTQEKDNRVSAKSNVYTTNIFGLDFSNIERPSIDDTGVNEIVGYYIVRNERTEENKTILDTGILIPTIKDKKDRFIASGFLAPHQIDVNTGLRTDIVGLINPEFKFNKREYKNFTVSQEGTYEVVDDKDDELGGAIKTKLYEQIIPDVEPGTSYDPEVNKSREKDTDGFDLHTISRNNRLKYINEQPYPSILASETPNEVFYLDAVSSKNIKDFHGKAFEVYNISCDNQIGILKFGKPVMPTYGLLRKALPYVVLKSKNTEFYPTFRTLPYMPETSIQDFVDNELSSCKVFNGDSYVSPLKYTSSVFYDIKLHLRGTKTGTWKVIIGAIVSVAALAVSILVPGVGTALGIGMTIGANLLLAGITIAFAASGIKANKIGKAYREAYNEGLRDCIEDTDTIREFGPHTDSENGDETDDEIQWFSDTLEDVWLESSVNMNWRKGLTNGLTDFLNPLEWVGEDTLNSYMLNKLTVLDTDRQSGRLYKGYAGAEIYEINEDYKRRNKQKIYFTLGIEYDCCSECSEHFPHRIMYSEPSFQEELTDNYKVFLPNNYIDLDGETGIITNMFKIQNNLFIHTEEALWNMPKNYQERVTSQIVSFLGTGSYFEIPPQRMVDDENGNSAGTTHKWGAIKTQHGYFFPCEKQGCFFRFDGKGLTPITDKGIKNEISYKIPILSDLHSSEFPDIELKNNPTMGVGYIAAYDSKKERLLFTKKDSIIKEGVTYDKSWTLSYSLKSGAWTSWHSYMPNIYISTSQNVFSWIAGDSHIWKHNVFGKYQNFYGVIHPYIVEFVSKGSPIVNKIWESLQIIAEVKKLKPDTKEFYDISNIFFNKAIFYNSRQCSGEVNIIVKDNDSLNYYSNSIKNLDLSTIVADRNERDWSLNNLRDFRKNYTEPIFKSDDASVKSEYFIDKVVNYGLNNSILGFNKDWTELENFRDKYLVIRLIFDNFDNYKLLLNYSIENETQSFR